MNVSNQIDQDNLAPEHKAQVERMLADKFICQQVGITLTEVESGKAKAELEVGPMHLNGVGICQGGVLFSLADYVLAAASNYTEDAVVSLDVSISFCKAANIGDRLTAEAVETCRTHSTALGDAVIKNEKGQTIAIARARGFVLHQRKS